MLLIFLLRCLSFFLMLLLLFLMRLLSFCFLLDFLGLLRLLLLDFLVGLLIRSVGLGFIHLFLSFFLLLDKGFLPPAFQLS